MTPLTICARVISVVNTGVIWHAQITNDDRDLLQQRCGAHWTTYSPFTRSSKHRANIKQAWWNPAPWLKCRPRLSPQLITCYIDLPITPRPSS